MDRPAVQEAEIEITPEMIDAAAEVLLVDAREGIISPVYARLVAKRVFEAALCFVQRDQE